eukprot:g7783.t1
MDVMLITVITGVFCLVLLWYFFSWSVGKRYRSRPFSKATSSLCWSLHVTFLLGMAKTLISILLSVTESQSQCEAFGIIGSVTTAVMVFSVYVFAFFRFKTVMNLRRRLIVLQMESSFETPIQDFIEKKKFLFFAVMSICLIIVTIVTKGIIHHIDDRTFCFCLFPTYAIISNTVVYILFTILMVSLTIREILVTRWLLRSSSYKIYRNVLGGVCDDVNKECTVLNDLTTNFVHILQLFSLFAVRLCFELGLCCDRYKTKQTDASEIPYSNQKQVKRIAAEKKEYKTETKAEVEDCSSSSSLGEGVSFRPLEGISAAVFQAPASANMETTVLHFRTKSDSKVQVPAKSTSDLIFDHLRVEFEQPETFVRLPKDSSRSSVHSESVDSHKLEQSASISDVRHSGNFSKSTFPSVLDDTV